MPSMCTETGPCSPQQRHQPGMMWRRRSEPRAGRDGWGSAALVTMLLCAATPTRGADSGAASAASAPRVLARQARAWECALNDNPCGDCTNAASSPCHLAAVCVARGSYAWAPVAPLAGARTPLRLRATSARGARGARGAQLDCRRAVPRAPPWAGGMSLCVARAMLAFARGPCGAPLATETHVLVHGRRAPPAALTALRWPQLFWKPCVHLQENGTAFVETVVGTGICTVRNAQLKTQNLQICEATLTCDEYLAGLKTRFCPVGRPALLLAEPLPASLCRAATRRRRPVHAAGLISAAAAADARAARVLAHGRCSQCRALP